MTRAEQSKLERSDKRRYRMIYSLIIAVGVIVLAMMVLTWWQGTRVQQLEGLSQARGERLSEVETESDKLSTALDQQRHQFEECKNKSSKSAECKKAVSPDAKAITGDDASGSIATITGQRGARGPRGVPGRDGADSTVPGPRGEPGKSVKGDKGDTGESAKGEKGDPGESVQGPKGDPGVAGKDGTPGRGIKSITCGTDDQWHVTYTDDTEATIDGPCRVPSPTPAPEPSE